MIKPSIEEYNAARDSALVAGEDGVDYVDSRKLAEAMNMSHIVVLDSIKRASTALFRRGIDPNTNIVPIRDSTCEEGMWFKLYPVKKVVV